MKQISLFLIFFVPSLCSAGVISDAVKIASDGLTQNSVTVNKREFLVAGSHQYRSLWAWDFAFASYGALKSGHTKAVHDSLEIYYSHQHPDGLLPRVIDRHGIEKRVLLGMAGVILKFEEPLKPQFETENGVISYIPNVILPWAASRYVLYTKDQEFAAKHFAGAEKAIQWMDEHTLENEIVCKQAPFSDWQDSVARTGCVGFTNGLYALSLRGLSEWANFLGDQKKADFYLARFHKFQSKFRAYFWDTEKKAIKNFTGDDHLSADINLLAVAYRIVDRADSEAIMKTLRATPLWEPYPGRATWPNYASSIKSKFPKLAGLSGYHDEIRWGWITALAALAENELGHAEAAQKILEAYSKQVVADGAVCEVYDYKAKSKKVKPVRRVVYKAERPFTWSSGFFLEAAL